jgi:hypothetical protein
MKSEQKNPQNLRSQYQELEAFCRLWMEANAAKEERIHELEAECNRLRTRVARLSRQVDRSQKTAVTRQVRYAR